MLDDAGCIVVGCGLCRGRRRSHGRARRGVIQRKRLMLGMSWQAEGLIGPALTYGPTPAQIFEQIRNNPQMAVIQQEMNPDNQPSLGVGETAQGPTAASIANAVFHASGRRIRTLPYLRIGSRPPRNNVVTATRLLCRRHQRMSADQTRCRVHPVR